MTEDWREVVARWDSEEFFTSTNEIGASLRIGPKGNEPIFSPMDLLLVSLAGCTGIDVVSILEKKRQNLQDFRVVVRGKRAEDPPRVYTQIKVTYLLWGENLEAAAVERAIKLSEEKYCSASAMLGAVAEISSSYHLFHPGELAPIDLPT